MIVLEWLFLTIAPCDAAKPWQLGSQDYNSSDEYWAIPSIVVQPVAIGENPPALPEPTALVPEPEEVVPEPEEVVLEPEEIEPKFHFVSDVHEKLGIGTSDFERLCQMHTAMSTYLGMKGRGRGKISSGAQAAKLLRETMKEWDNSY
ncbi:hypothetical protein Tco_0902781 [Tanacetum coccineum]